MARAGLVGLSGRLARVMAVALAALFAAAADAQVGAGPPNAEGFPSLKAAHSDRECAVWAREQSFARSVERHDAAAFAEHLHAGAVFNAGDPEADRGRDAVVKAWAPIVAGERVVLRWWPGTVQIEGDPDIALSRGPFLMEVPSAEPGRRWRVGQFQSVWVRDRASGTWHVLYDMGAVPPQPMPTPEEARRWVAARATRACAGG